MKSPVNITRSRVAMIIGYGGTKPSGISKARWAAIVKQVKNNGTKG